VLLNLDLVDQATAAVGLEVGGVQLNLKTVKT
jgi:hypothetical protein